MRARTANYCLNAHARNSIKMAASASSVVVATDTSVFEWLTSVGFKLSSEGLQLMKTLYLPTLQLWKLNRVNDPRQLHDIPLQGDATSFWRGDRPRERDTLSPRDSLALFIHRLNILAPQSTVEDKLGARDCLTSLDKCGVAVPTLNVPLSKESRVIECLVQSYVNINSTQQRLVTKRALADRVGVNVENTIFDIFVKMFTKEIGPSRCKNMVAEFVYSLQQARSPRETYMKLKHDLRDCDGPHELVTIPGIIIFLYYMYTCVLMYCNGALLLLP